VEGIQQRQQRQGFGGKEVYEVGVILLVLVWFYFVLLVVSDPFDAFFEVRN
jgi:hypothetical protein